MNGITQRDSLLANTDKRTVEDFELDIMLSFAQSREALAFIKNFQSGLIILRYQKGLILRFSVPGQVGMS